MAKKNKLPEPWTVALFAGGILVEALITLLGTPFALTIVIFIAGAATGAWVTTRYNRKPP